MKPFLNKGYAIDNSYSSIFKSTIHLSKIYLL